MLRDWVQAAGKGGRNKGCVTRLPPGSGVRRRDGTHQKGDRRMIRAGAVVAALDTGFLSLALLF
jgi:hypothetical protein